ncbi:MAG: putative transporter [Paludibacteraceae bacterium]|nr:putative transporter [Paludibacteraceae bacterium]MBP5136038.1 putative transporter [Paludibacteraceae bacterium]MBP5742323.1 putative transporter [Paludibacteraceae bacterium]
MNFLSDLFTNPSAITTLLYLAMTAFIGVLLGKVKFINIKLGIAGVLFTGIALGHFIFPVDGSQEKILNFIRDFGLILFVYSIGIDTGPRFLSSFKKDGLKLNLLAIGIVVSGLITTLIIFYFFNVNGDKGDVFAGIMSGAVTNTPGLGAAQQVINEQIQQNPNIGLDVKNLGSGYAIAYPFGVIGLIFVILLIKLIFRINIKEEEQSYIESLGDTGSKLESVEITIKNPAIYGKTINYIKTFVDAELAISRIFRNGEYILAKEDEVIQEGDVIYGVSEQNCLENLQIKLGDVVLRERRNITGTMDLISVLVTNRKIAGKTIEQIGIYRRYEANITRIYRSGMEILPTKKSTLELGDTVKIIGDVKILNDVKNELGNSNKELAIPNIVPMFIGIFIGIIAGSIPIAIPGMPVPAKLGIAGGPLLIALLLGNKGRINKLNFYMTPGANFMLREFGIILFLASVGLMAGKGFVQTLVNGGWMWMIYGAFITFVPVFIFAVIARLMKINYLKICGFVAGASTDPPVLEFANGLAEVPAQASAYATVYPLTMFLRIVFAQILIFIII